MNPACDSTHPRPWPQGNIHALMKPDPHPRPHPDPSSLARAASTCRTRSHPNHFMRNDQSVTAGCMCMRMWMCMCLQVRTALGDKVPVLMVSAAAQMGAVHTCLQRGADLCAAPVPPQVSGPARPPPPSLLPPVARSIGGGNTGERASGAPTQARP